MKNDLIKYIELQKKLLQFELVEKIGELRSKYLFKLCVGLLMFFFSLFISIGISLYLNALFDSVYLGFIAISAFFLLLVLTLIVCKKKMVNAIFNNYINQHIPS